MNRGQLGHPVKPFFFFFGISEKNREGNLEFSKSDPPWLYFFFSCENLKTFRDFFSPSEKFGKFAKIPILTFSFFRRNAVLHAFLYLLWHWSFARKCDRYGRFLRNQISIFGSLDCGKFFLEKSPVLFHMHENGNVKFFKKIKPDFLFMGKNTRDFGFFFLAMGMC